MRHSGVLNIDKPTGWTSREVVDRVVRLVHPAKVGHAGTLDPLATGVLVVCVGHATRLIQHIQEGRKQYLARFQLGVHSDTDDVTGNVQAGGDWSHVTQDQLVAELRNFTGRIMQTPPQFSAIHIEGTRAYNLARRGQTIELQARPVDVFSMNLTDFQPPEFEILIECGGGTYIRSIGRDLGLKLGCGCVMTRLRRLKVGEFGISTAVPIDNLNTDTFGRCTQPPISAVSQYRTRELTADEVLAVRRGRTIPAHFQANASSQTPTRNTESQSHDNRIALIAESGEFIGIGEIIAGKLQPRIVFPAD